MRGLFRRRRRLLGESTVLTPAVTACCIWVTTAGVESWATTMWTAAPVPLTAGRLATTTAAAATTAPEMTNPRLKPCQLRRAVCRAGFSITK